MPQATRTVPKIDAREAESTQPPISDLDKVADRIAEVETRKGKDLSGKHGKCVAIGKDNTYSYAPGTCYQNEKETRKIVIDWLERKTKVMSLSEALCLYGGAGKTKNCEYHQKFLNI